MKKETVPIKGMHCATCALTIKNTLSKEDGVLNCDVNFGTEKAKIEYDPQKTSISELSKKIEPLGYSFLAQKDSHKQHSHEEHLGIDQSKEEKLKELMKLKNKLLFIIPLTAFIFIAMLWDILYQTLKLVPPFFIPEELYNPLLFIIATASVFWVGTPYIAGVIRFVKYKVADMDTLVGIGTLVAYIYSSILLLYPKIIETLKLPEALYFDVTIVVIGFITLGKYLEAKSKLKTGEAIEKLLNLQAKTALVERDGERLEIPLEQVVVGDLLIVKPGAKIPVDGIILEGKSSIDESMITGESIPTDKKEGDEVIGGTVNKQGTFKFKATKVGSETLLAHIVKMVEEAQGSRAPVQKLVDKISSIFVPAVLIIAILALITWLTVGSQFLPFDRALTYGLLSFIGTLIIACPCALGLATPTAIIVGTGKGAENGILVKDAESLEKLSKVDTIVTDKTGTITQGKPKVTDFFLMDNIDEVQKNLNWNIPEDMNIENYILSIAHSLEKNSEHPLSEAIVEFTKVNNAKEFKVEDFEAVSGLGIVGTINKKRIVIGTKKLMETEKVVRCADLDKTSERLLSEGKSLAFIGIEGKNVALMGISDTLKDNAKDTINKLHKLGLKVILLTGDNEKTAKHIAKLVGIDEAIAEVLPNQKSEKIKELQNEGRIVAMVGDGVNDAPALAQADIGIAMATGTDVAIESAQITLLKGDISKLLKAIKLSKFTMSAIKQNLFWAFIYNLIGIPLAAGLMYPIFGILLNPIFAGLAMALSSVSVVSNSLRLKLKTL